MSDAVLAVKLLCPFPTSWHPVAGSALPELPRKSHAFNYIHQRAAAALEADGGKFRHLRYARTCGCLRCVGSQPKTTNSIVQQKHLPPVALFGGLAGAFVVCITCWRVSFRLNDGKTRSNTSISKTVTPNPPTTCTHVRVLVGSVRCWRRKKKR